MYRIPYEAPGIALTAFHRPRVASSRLASSPCGRALHALTGVDALSERFFSWRGASGRRYVCSVFQAGESAFVADISCGVVVGVARDGEARPVCVFRAGVGLAGDRAALWRRAHELGVAEWHVLFGADEAALGDLAASLLN